MSAYIGGNQDYKLYIIIINEFAQREFDPSGSSDLVLHSSINRCVVNGRDAMAHIY